MQSTYPLIKKTSVAPASSAPQSSSIETRYKRQIGLILISPWLIGLVVFKLVPILASLIFSFTDVNLLTPFELRFNGVRNYVNVLGDLNAVDGFIKTVRLAVIVIPLQTAASIFIAALLSGKDLLMKGTMRVLFFLPSIIPSFAATLMWSGFVNPSTGWLSRLILSPLGLGSFYQFSTWDTPAEALFIFSSLWAAGPGFLIMMGAMQGIPPEIYEAAWIDGAGRLTRFFRMTLPLISPAIFFSLVLNLTAAFGGGILLDRGSYYRTSFSSYDSYITYVMFDLFHMGYASGLAWIFFLFVLVVVLILFGTSRRWVYFPDREQGE
jgi:ABC-type sugar transport system permease subunit